MLQKGSRVHEAPINATVFIESDDTFLVYEIDEEGNRVRIIGPFGADVRRLRFYTKTNIHKYEIFTPNETLYQLTVTQPGKEKANGTPFEIPAGMDRPLTLKEEMQRYIQEELSTQFEAMDKPTFEEEDDFDIADDDPLSAYELTELQEEYIDTLPAEQEATSAADAASNPPQTNPNTGTEEHQPDLPLAKNSPPVQPKEAPE